MKHPILLTMHKLNAYSAAWHISKYSINKHLWTEWMYFPELLLYKSGCVKLGDVNQYVIKYFSRMLCKSEF